MTTTLAHYEGMWGEAWELDPFPPMHVDHTATLGWFFIHAPPAHPIWPHYTLSCIHLRDIEGQSKPPHRKFPTASHEYILAALNPEERPWRHETVAEKIRYLAENKRSAHLLPLNACEQVANATDEQAKTLLHQIARGLVLGIIPIEPSDFLNGHETWRTAVWRTMEHIKSGGHPSEN